uniref:Protein xylosyltransferase n=1 Tax=Alexandrium catenella TaxID=2925 RepID=A0A7S1M8B5_ALECA
MQLKRVLTFALCPAALALRSKAEVDPADLALALEARANTKPQENQCRNMHTPKMCKASSGMGNHSATVVISTYREDIHWLNEMPWSDTINVLVHDRAGKRSHESKMTLQDNLILAEESEVKVKALNPRRRNPIKFIDVPNKGDEAGAYLWWIIQNYESLPDVSFFIQGHRCADHADFDMATALPNVRQCFHPKQGYLDLNAYRTVKQGGNTKCKWTKMLLDYPIMGFHIEKLGDIWTELFHKELGPLPNKICWDAFAQFAVSKAAIRKHPLSFYKKLHKGTVAGVTTMEFFWRAVFEPSAVSMEEPPKYDRLGHLVMKPHELTPEEVLEQQRHVDARAHLRAKEGYGHGRL